jgi:hypothetical protein
MTAAAAQPAPASAAVVAGDAHGAEIAGRAPQMAATMQDYLDQLTVSSRPSTVQAAALALRHLAEHVTTTDPGCMSVAAIERRHIESYKLALAARPGKRGSRLSPQTIRHNLGMARTFFERVIDWDYPDAPRRVPILAGDLPKADEPTPKFLDDPTAAKFMAALATGRTAGDGSSLSWAPGPACAPASWAVSVTAPCTASATATGCASRSANSTTTGRFRCTPCLSG